MNYPDNDSEEKEQENEKVDSSKVIELEELLEWEWERFKI